MIKLGKTRTFSIKVKDDIRGVHAINTHTHQEKSPWMAKFDPRRPISRLASQAKLRLHRPSGHAKLAGSLLRESGNETPKMMCQGTSLQ